MISLEFPLSLTPSVDPVLLGLRISTLRCLLPDCYLFILLDFDADADAYNAGFTNPGFLLVIAESLAFLA